MFRRNNILINLVNYTLLLTYVMRKLCELHSCMRMLNLVVKCYWTFISPSAVAIIKSLEYQAYYSSYVQETLNCKNAPLTRSPYAICLINALKYKFPSCCKNCDLQLNNYLYYKTFSMHLTSLKNNIFYIVDLHKI